MKTIFLHKLSIVCRNLVLIYFVFFSFQQGFGQDTSIFFFTEICDNGRDDDGDGLIDEQDADCTSGIEICGNGLDDDLDGLIDWADSDCVKDNRVFMFKLQLLEEDTTGSNVWGVYVKPVRGFKENDRSIVGVGQITIILEKTVSQDHIYNFQSISGRWLDGFVYSFNTDDVSSTDVDQGFPSTDYAYYSIGFVNSRGIPPFINHQEILLFTFQSTQNCPNMLTLFDHNTDPYRDHFSSEHINNGMEIGVINLSTRGTYGWLGNYGHYASDCNDCDNDGIPNGIEDEDGNISIICGGSSPTDSQADRTRVHLKLYLEGFYDPSTDEMHTNLKDTNLLPTHQPFRSAPWNYLGTDSVTNFPANVVDWVLIMSRDSTGQVFDQAVGFIDKDGALVSTDGTLGIPLLNAIGSTISIHHRSHLAILSAVPYSEGVYDFTQDASAALGNQQLKEVEGKYVLFVGDYDASGVINTLDYNSWKINSSSLNEYLPSDADGNTVINSLDYNLWTKNKAKIGEQMIRY